MIYLNITKQKQNCGCALTFWLPNFSIELAIMCWWNACQRAWHDLESSPPEIAQIRNPFWYHDHKWPGNLIWNAKRFFVISREKCSASRAINYDRRSRERDHCRSGEHHLAPRRFCWQLNKPTNPRAKLCRSENASVYENLDNFAFHQYLSAFGCFVSVVRPLLFGFGRGPITPAGPAMVRMDRKDLN